MGTLKAFAALALLLLGATGVAAQDDKLKVNLDDSCTLSKPP